MVIDTAIGWVEATRREYVGLNFLISQLNVELGLPQPKKWLLTADHRRMFEMTFSSSLGSFSAGRVECELLAGRDARWHLRH